MSCQKKNQLQRRKEAGTKAVCSKLYLFTEIITPFVKNKIVLKVIKDIKKIPPNNTCIKTKKVKR